MGELFNRYSQAQQSPNPGVQALEQVRLAAWKKKDASGSYLHHHLHACLIWDPRVRPLEDTASPRKNALNGPAGSMKSW
jgi:hypothetical protein